MCQRWSRGHKARDQGQGQGHKKNPRSRPRPRTAFPRTDTLEAKDRNTRGQGQGPRTQAQVLSKKKKKKGLHKNFSGDLQKKKKKKKKKVFTKIFQEISTKKRFLKNFSSAPQNFTNSKNSAVLEPRTGQFSGQGQGQGLQNLSSRTSSRPRTSSRTPPLICALAINFLLSRLNFILDLNLLIHILYTLLSFQFHMCKSILRLLREFWSKSALEWL